MYTVEWKKDKQNSRKEKKRNKSASQGGKKNLLWFS